MPKKLDFGYECVTPGDESKTSWFGKLVEFFTRLVTHNHDGETTDLVDCKVAMPIGGFTIYNPHNGLASYNNSYMEADGSSIDNEASPLDGVTIDNLDSDKLLALTIDETSWANDLGDDIEMNSIHGICIGNGLYIIAGALDGIGELKTSSDSKTWTSRDSGFGNGFDIRGVGYGNGLYIAVGKYGKLTTSPDGITWTSRTSGFNAYSIYSVVYGDELYVIVGISGSLRTSLDGITWTRRTSDFGSTNIYSVCYGNGLYVAVGADSKISTSPDGITWTARSVDFGGVEVNLETVYYGNELYVAAGLASKIATSPDGITWTERVSGFDPWDTHPFYGGSYGKGIYVLVNSEGNILTSPDGVTWTHQTSPTSSTLYAVAYADNLFIAGGYQADKPLVRCGKKNDYKFLVRYL